MGNSIYDLGYFQNYSYNVTNPALLFYSLWESPQVYLICTKGMLSPLHIKNIFLLSYKRLCRLRKWGQKLESNYYKVSFSMRQNRIGFLSNTLN